MLTLSNLVLGAGLVLLGIAQGFVTLAVAWAALGVGMAMGLYDPAFATLTGLYGRAARGPITGITLIAGLRARSDGRYRPFSMRNLVGAGHASSGRRCIL